jgi:hypothetical protein
MLNCIVNKMKIVLYHMKIIVDMTSIGNIIIYVLMSNLLNKENVCKQLLINRILKTFIVMIKIL